MTPFTAWKDEKVETVIGNLLIVGVCLAGLIVFAGGIIYLLHYGSTRMDYHVFRGEPANLRNVRGIISYSATLHGRGVIQLGILALIATPVARVAFSVFGFAAERDHMYVLFTLAVLMILLYSLFGSASIA